MKIFKRLMIFFIMLLICFTITGCGVDEKVIDGVVSSANSEINKVETQESVSSQTQSSKPTTSSQVENNKQKQTTTQTEQTTTQTEQTTQTQVENKSTQNRQTQTVSASDLYSRKIQALTEENYRHDCEISKLTKERDDKLNVLKARLSAVIQNTTPYYGQSSSDYTTKQSEYLNKIVRLTRDVESVSRDTSANGMKLYYQYTEDLEEVKKELDEFENRWSATRQYNDICAEKQATSIEYQKKIEDENALNRDNVYKIQNMK